MPPVVGAFVVSVAGTAVALGGLSWLAVGIAAGLTALSYVVGVLTKPKAPRLNLSIQDRKQLVRLPEAPRRVVYGETELSPQVLYMHTTEAGATKYLHMYCAICDHSLESISQFVLGGRFLGTTELATLSAGTRLDVGAPTTAASGYTSQIRDEAATIASQTYGASIPPISMLAGLSGDGDCQIKVSAAYPDYDVPAEFRCTGMSWLYLRLANSINPAHQKAWQSVPNFQLRVKRDKASLQCDYCEPAISPLAVLSGIVLTGAPAYTPSIRQVYGRRGIDYEDDASLADAPLSFAIDGDRIWLAGIHTDDDGVHIETYRKTSHGARVVAAAPDAGVGSLLSGDGFRFMLYNSTKSQVWVDKELDDWDGAEDFPVASQLHVPLPADELVLYVYQADAGQSDLTAFQTPLPHSRDNAATCAYDYLARYTTYGLPIFGQPAIDYASVEAAAEVCRMRGWSANGVITLDDAPDAVAQQFTLAMGGGMLSDSRGKLVFRAGGVRAPAMTITEDDILDGWSIVPSFARQDRSSSLSLEYIEQIGGVDTIQSITLANTRAASQFGDKPERGEATFITSKANALIAAQVSLLREWDSMQMVIPVNASALSLSPADTIQVDMPRFGIVGKKFVVVGATIRDDLSVELTLHEEGDHMWNPVPLDATEITPPALPNIGHGGSAAVVEPVAPDALPEPEILLRNTNLLAGTSSDGLWQGYNAASNTGTDAFGSMGGSRVITFGQTAYSIDAARWAPARDADGYAKFLISLTPDHEAAIQAADTAQLRIRMFRKFLDLEFFDAPLSAATATSAGWQWRALAGDAAVRHDLDKLPPTSGDAAYLGYGLEIYAPVVKSVEALWIGRFRAGQGELGEVGTNAEGVGYHSRGAAQWGELLSPAVASVEYVAGGASAVVQSAWVADVGARQCYFGTALSVADTRQLLEASSEYPDGARTLMIVMWRVHDGAIFIHDTFANASDFLDRRLGFDTTELQLASIPAVGDEFGVALYKQGEGFSNPPLTDASQLALPSG